jgi:hypothetical protein
MLLKEPTLVLRAKFLNGGGIITIIALTHQHDLFLFKFKVDQLNEIYSYSNLNLKLIDYDFLKFKFV